MFFFNLFFFENRLKKIEVLKARNLVSDKIQFTCLRLNLPFGHDISIYRSRIQFTVQRFNLPFDHEISIYCSSMRFQFTRFYRPLMRFQFTADHEISIYLRPRDFNLPFEQERFQFTSERVCSNRKFNSFYGKFLL